jgi:hypothetical protein
VDGMLAFRWGSLLGSPRRPGFPPGADVVSGGHIVAIPERE